MKRYMQKLYCVYILTNKNNSVLYVGVSGDLKKRVWAHKRKIVEGFTKKYNVSTLVYFECSEDVHSALQREKQLKNWHRQWKINLISEKNPEWVDLYESL